MISKMKQHLMLLLMVVTMTVIEAQIFTYSSTPVAQQTLQQVAASLQLYVDPLPQMPIIYGFSMEGANLVSVNLTISMYQINRVIFYILCFFRNLCHQSLPTYTTHTHKGKESSTSKF